MKALSSSMLILAAVLLGLSGILLTGKCQIDSLADYAIAPEESVAAQTSWVYLPSVLKNAPLPPVTPTPTATPVPGCSTVPTLIGPANESNLDTLIPLFQWDSGNNPNATEFELKVYADSACTFPVYGLSSRFDARGERQWRINLNLDPATIYYWRAHLMCGSTKGPYSETWSFTTGSGGVILPGPSLLSPANGSALVGTTANLRWASVSGADEYWVWYSGGGWDRGRLVQDTEMELSSTLDSDTTYEWWVQARNDYALGTESAHWQFTTGMSHSTK